MIPLCACPIGASYAPANVKLQEGRGRAQEGHFNLAEIFCSNALLQCICGWSNQSLNFYKTVLESPLKWSKVPLSPLFMPNLLPQLNIEMCIRATF